MQRSLAAAVAAAVAGKEVALLKFGMSEYFPHSRV